MAAIGDLGEDEFLARLMPRLPVGQYTLLGPGDDAALVPAPDGRAVVSLDLLVEGRHFRRDWSTGFDVGWKAATQNLADIAAMGAQPTSLVIGLGLPADLPEAFALAIADGLAGVCAPAGVGVDGGDVSEASEVLVAVAAYGDLGGRAPVRRSGAQPGDVVAHAGVLGESAAGLAALAAGRKRSFPALVAAHLRPVSPLTAGYLAADAGATSMMDVSDGLLRDLGRISVASGVAIDVDLSAAPFAEALAVLTPAATALDADPLEWILAGGEDHGLVATFPAGRVLPLGFTAIGTVSAGHGLTVDGGPVPATAKGWEHYRRN